MSVARNVVFNPSLVPGGGATEMAVSVGLHNRARAVTGVEGWPFRAVADALEVIPRTLIQNAGGNAIRVLTELRVSPFSASKHRRNQLSCVHAGEARQR
jgi:T-complex protein 1 subunit gamma